ncbi:hypothetical protein KDA_42050 [Dictyobacter alpinus]|uniref:Uncharacterized protein n=1 Tax=Dictyobacter alpinus TaxID=2014873 RepID=A0A402BBB3_9CHLR|nr:hypothetical protein [Dictyobacter alpinus]GCE28721.1 hypothetical protein KDA_42050 [Dictyobacter alpinus]
MSDLNKRLDDEIRTGKRVEEELKKNTGMSNPLNRGERSDDERSQQEIEDNRIVEPADLDQDAYREASERRYRSEDEQSSTAVTDTTADNLQAAENQAPADKKRGQVDLGGVPNREGSSFDQREQGASTGGASSSDSTVTSGTGKSAHAGEVNSTDRGSLSASDINQTGGEPPTGGSNKQ